MVAVVTRRAQVNTVWGQWSGEGVGGGGSMQPLSCQESVLVHGVELQSSLPLQAPAPLQL